MVARLFANPRGSVGFQELKNTSFFQAFLVTRDYKMGKSRAELTYDKTRVEPGNSGLSGSGLLESHGTTLDETLGTLDLGSYCVSGGQLASITLNSSVTDTCGGISSAPATSYKCLL
jgi:hypothetical protein